MSDERFYGLYMADPAPPVLDPPHRSPGLMAVLSFVLPGLGEFVCGQVGWGFFWLTIGVLLGPIGPAIAAHCDARTANKEWIAEAYREYLQDHRGLSPPAPSPSQPALAPASERGLARRAAVGRCGGCGAGLSVGARFCGRCGAPTGAGDRRSH